MNRRLAILVGVLLVLAGAAFGAWAFVGRDAPTSGMPTRTVSAGSVTVSMTPLVIDSSSTGFRISMDTHSGSLDLDLSTASELLVDGQVAPRGVWDGAGPGGHHREGTLTFPVGAQPGASLELRIRGLPTDVSASWQAP